MSAKEHHDDHCPGCEHCEVQCETNPQEQKPVSRSIDVEMKPTNDREITLANFWYTQGYEEGSKTLFSLLCKTRNGDKT